MISSQLILASTSPYRKKLLERLHVPFRTELSHVDESLVKHQTGSPEQKAQLLARQKAESVAARFPNAVVIGGDQMTVVDNQVLDKPVTAEVARAQLAVLAGKTHRLVTATCVLSPGKAQEWVDVTELTMRALTAEEIASYVNLEPALDCGGGYKIEGLGITLFTHIKGNDPTSIEGLPLISLSAVLRELGFTFR